MPVTFQCYCCFLPYGWLNTFQNAAHICNSCFWVCNGVSVDNASLLHLFILHSGISPLSGSVMSQHTFRQAPSVATLSHSHTPPHTTSYRAVGKIYGQNVGDTFSHTKSRHAQTHTCRNRTISSVSDSTKWHFTITLWSEGREEVDLTKCLGMKGGLSHLLTKKVKVEQPEQASLWADVSHVHSLTLGCHMNI